MIPDPNLPLTFREKAIENAKNAQESLDTLAKETNKGGVLGPLSPSQAIEFLKTTIDLANLQLEIYRTGVE